MSATRLAAMLCSRLCHDLVSPVGALVNGVEILGEEDDPDMRAQVLDFLGQSAEQTSARLQFFRLAFGGGAGFGNEVDPEEGRKALAALLGDGKVRLDWSTNGARIDKTLLKLVLNLALIAAESLIRGGTLTVRIASADSESPLEIEASGERLILSDEMRLALAGRMPAERIEPRTAPAFLAALLAADLGMDIALTDSADAAVRMHLHRSRPAAS